MFESIVANILVKYLGGYIENLDPKSLNIAALRGVLDLYDLKLKKSAFDGFDLPVVVVQGYVGKLHLNIPWTSLSSSPVIAEISDVFLVVKPKKNVENTEEEQNRKNQFMKEKSLESYDILKAQQYKSEEESKSGTDAPKQDETFVSKLTETVVNNVQVKIHNVHARYEDLSNPERVTLFGITLKDLSIESTNENWQKAFIKQAQKFVFKLAELKELSVYLNKEDKTIFSTISSAETFKRLMKESISEKATKQYIVHPIDATLKAVLQKEGFIDLSVPKYTVDLLFDKISIKMDDLQYRNLLRMVEYLGNYKQIEEFSAFRPKLPPVNRESRLDWWKYGMMAAYRTAKKNYFTMSQIMQRKKDKAAYIELYKRSKNVPWLEKLEGYDIDRFKGLERKLDLDSIIVFRELADAELKEESKKYAQYQETHKPKRGGFFSWWGGGSTTEEEDPNAVFKMNEQDRERLYKTIGYDVSDQVSKNTLPPDFVRLNVNFLLKTGDITILDSTTAEPIISIVYNTLRADFKMKESSIVSTFTLDSFEILDTYTKNTLFPAILSKKIVPQTPKAVTKQPKEDRLVAISVETNPPSGKSDLCVKIHLEEMDIVVNTPLLQKILAFFIVPSDIDLSAVQSIALKQLSHLQHQASTQLRIALQNKKVLDLYLNVKAPKFIFPERCSSETTEMIVFDLGLLKVLSDIDKSERTKRLKNQELKEEDYYDKFKLDISDIEIIVTNYKDFRSGEYIVAKQNRLLERVSLNLDLAISITPSSVEYAQTKLKANVPNVKFNINPEKLEVFLNIINKIMLVVDDPSRLSREQLSKRSMLRMNGPIHKDDENEWGDYWVELRQKRLIIYETERSTRPIATITLGDKVMLKDFAKSGTQGDETEQNTFAIILPQQNGTNYQFLINSKTEKAKWFDALRHIISSANAASKQTQEAPETTLKEEKSGIQTILLAAFTLNKFSILINYKNQDISEINLNNLTLGMNLRNYDRIISLKVQSFNIVNLLDNTKKYILSSTQLKSQDLVDLTFINSAKLSPYVQNPSSEYHDLLLDSSSAVAFKFQKLEIFFDPLILSKFVNFGYDLMNTVNKTSIGRSRAFAVTEKKKDTYEELQDKDYLRRNAFKVKASMEDVSLILVDVGSTFTGFTMARTSVMFLTTPAGISVNGTVGDLLAVDHSEDTIYREILGLNSKKHSLIDFSFSTASDIRSTVENVPFYNKILKAKMHSVKIVFLMRLLKKLQMYFSEGPLMEALASGSQKAAQYSIEAAKKQAEAIEKIKLELDFINPLVILPVAHNSNDKLIGNLGKIRIHNELIFAQPTRDMTETNECYYEKNWSERYTIELKEMNLRTSLKSRVTDVVEKADMTINIDLAVVNKANEIPGIDFSLEVPLVGLKMSHAQYQMIFQLINRNFGDTGGVTSDVAKAKAIADKKKKQADPAATKSPEITTQSKSEVKSPEEAPPKRYNNQIASRYIIKFPNINLSLLRGDGNLYGKENPLARLHMYGLVVTYVARLNNSSQTSVQIQDVNAFDYRVETKSIFKEFITTKGIPNKRFDSSEQSKQEVEQKSLIARSVSKNMIGHESSAFINFSYETQGLDSLIVISMSNPRIIFVPGIVKEIQQFFTNMYPPKTEEEKKVEATKVDTAPNLELQGDIVITHNTWLGEDIVLTPTHRLIIKKNETGEVSIDGEGHTVAILSKGEQTPLIVIEDGMTLKLRNTVMKHVGDLTQYLSKGTNSMLVAPATQGVVHITVESEQDIIDQATAVPEDSEKNEKKEPAKTGRMALTATLGKPSIIFPEDSENKNTRLLVVELGLIATYNQDAEGENGVFSIDNMKCFVESEGIQVQGAPVIEPISLDVELASIFEPTKSYRQLKVFFGTDMRTRIAYQDVQLIMKIIQSFNKKEAQEKQKEEEKKPQDINQVLAAIQEQEPAAQVTPVSDDEHTGSDNGSEADDEDLQSAASAMSDDDDFKEARSDDEDEDEKPVESPQTPLADLNAVPEKQIVAPVKKVDEYESENEEEEEMQRKEKEKQQQKVIDTKPQVEQFYDIQLSSDSTLSVLIVDDIRGYDVPLIDLNVTNLQLESEIAMKNLMSVNATLKFALGANFYNMVIADWEPIVEPWGCTAMFRRIPTGSAIELYRNELLVTNEPPKSEQMPVVPLNINLSKFMLNAITTTAKLWKEGLSSNKPISQRFDPYIIRNHTGTDISFFRDTSNTEVVNQVVVGPSKEVSFDFPENKVRADQEVWKKNLVIYVMVPGREPQSVNVRRVGKTKIINKEENLFYMIETEQVEGRKIITVRSGLKLVNSTTVPWELGMVNNEGEVKSYGIIEPNHSMGLPVVRVDDATLCVRPVLTTPTEPAQTAIDKYRWSDSAPGFKISEILRQPTITRMFTCKNENELKAEHSFHCILKVGTAHNIDAQQYNKFKATPYLYQQFDFTLSICPPLSIENLIGLDLDYILFDKRTTEGAKMELQKGVLKKGEKIYVYHANFRNSILLRCIPCFGVWKNDRIALLHSNEKPPKPLTKQLSIYDSKHNPLELMIDYLHQTGIAHREVMVYTPYWIINRTGQPMTIKDGSQALAGLDEWNAAQTGAAATPVNEPLLFTFREQQQSKNKKISISVAGSPFSRPFSVDNAGVAGDLEFVKDKRYNVGLYVAIAPGKFKRTKIVTFTARYVIMNKTDTMLHVKQTQSAKHTTLESGKQMNWYWPETGVSMPTLNVTVMEDESNQYLWSAPIKLTSLGELPVKLLSKHSKTPYVLSVNIIQEEGTIYIICSKPEKPYYVIMNQLSSDVEICQQYNNATWFIPKNSKVSYCWDDNNGTQKINIRIIGGSVINGFDINKVNKAREYTKVQVGTQRVYLCVNAKGPTRVLRISNAPKSEEDEPEVHTLRVIAMIKALGLSLINDEPKEIAYLYFQDLNVKYDQTNLNQLIEVTLNNLHLDNQDYEAPQPVVLARSNTKVEKPLIHFSMNRSVQEKSINLFPYFSLNIQELDLYLEFSFMMKLWDFIQDFMRSTDEEDNAAVEEITKKFESQPTSADILQNSKKMYFNILELHPVKLNLTFRYNKPESQQEHNPLTLLLDGLGVTFVNVDDAPIKLNALILEHPFLTQSELIDRVKKHYVRAVTGEFYKIIGSLDIIGNPIGLFNDVATGWKDFFYEPATAIVQSPEDFGKGIAKGTASLFKNTLHGTFNASSKVTGTIKKTVNLLTFDKEFIKESESRSNAKFKKPRGVGEGFKEGTEAFAKSVFEGAVGLFKKPIEGASKEGALGFFKGVGIGIVGIPTKPVSGLLEFAQKTSEGISSSQKDYHIRARYPRTFREDGALLPFSEYDAFGQYLLSELNLKEQQTQQSSSSTTAHIAKDERCLFYCINEGKTIAMLTNRNVLNIKVPDNIIDWRVEIPSVETVGKDNRGGILICCAGVKKTGLFGLGGTSNVTVTRKVFNTQDPVINTMFMQKLGAVIKQSQKKPRKK